MRVEFTHKRWNARVSRSASIAQQRVRTNARRFGPPKTSWNSRWLPPVGLARAHAHVVTHPSDCPEAQRSQTLWRVAIGLVVEPGEDLRAPVADAAANAEAARAGAEVAPVAQGRDGDADNVGDFLHGQQFVVGVRSDRHSGPLDVAHGVPPGGLPGAIREVRRMSLLLHKDRGQVLVVNREEKEASPPSYPSGVRRACASSRHPRKLPGLPAEPPFIEMS